MLCFVINKFKYFGLKTLKSLLVDYYTPEDISTSKDLLFGELDVMNLDNFPKIARRRRDSTGKAILDIDDILLALTTLDEQKMLHKLSTFTATSPDKMPSSRLAEGDLSILLTKINSIEDIVSNLQKSLKDCCEIGKNNSAAIHVIGTNITEIKLKCDDHFSINNAPADTCHRRVNLTGNDTVGKGQSLPFIDNSSLDPSIHASTTYSRNQFAQQPSRLSTGRTWGSAAGTDSESEFTTFHSPRQLRKANKRKEISPVVECSISSDRTHNKRQDDGSQKEAPFVYRPNSYAKAVQNNVIVPASITYLNNTDNAERSSFVTINRNKKIMGHAINGRLKAAEHSPTPISVFSITNIAVGYSVSDIRKHCSDLGVKVRFCYDVTAVNNSSKAFKLAVGAGDKVIIENELSWPNRVIIRQWNYHRRTVVQNHQESNSQHQEETAALAHDRASAAVSSHSVGNIQNADVAISTTTSFTLASRDDNNAGEMCISPIRNVAADKGHPDRELSAVLIINGDAVLGNQSGSVATDINLFNKNG